MKKFSFIKEVILEYIQNLLEAQSPAEQAHELGLQHVGWGYWADETGAVVARTIGDDLVKLAKPMDADTVDIPNEEDEYGKQLANKGENALEKLALHAIDHLGYDEVDESTKKQIRNLIALTILAGQVPSKDKITNAMGSAFSLDDVDNLEDYLTILANTKSSKLVTAVAIAVKMYQLTKKKKPPVTVEPETPTQVSEPETGQQILQQSDDYLSNFINAFESNMGFAPSEPLLNQIEQVIFTYLEGEQIHAKVWMTQNSTGEILASVLGIELTEEDKFLGYFDLKYYNQTGKHASTGALEYAADIHNLLLAGKKEAAVKKLKAAYSSNITDVLLGMIQIGEPSAPSIKAPEDIKTEDDFISTVEALFKQKYNIAPSGGTLALAKIVAKNLFTKGFDAAETALEHTSGAMPNLLMDLMSKMANAEQENGVTEPELEPTQKKKYAKKPLEFKPWDLNAAAQIAGVDETHPQWDLFVKEMQNAEAATTTAQIAYIGQKLKKAGIVDWDTWKKLDKYIKSTKGSDLVKGVKEPGKIKNKKEAAEGTGVSADTLEKTIDKALQAIADKLWKVNAVEALGDKYEQFTDIVATALTHPDSALSAVTFLPDTNWNWEYDDEVQDGFEPIFGLTQSEWNAIDETIAAIREKYPQFIKKAPSAVEPSISEPVSNIDPDAEWITWGDEDQPAPSEQPSSSEWIDWTDIPPELHDEFMQMNTEYQNNPPETKNAAEDVYDATLSIMGASDTDAFGAIEIKNALAKASTLSDDPENDLVTILSPLIELHGKQTLNVDEFAKMASIFSVQLSVEKDEPYGPITQPVLDTAKEIGAWDIFKNLPLKYQYEIALALAQLNPGDPLTKFMNDAISVLDKIHSEMGLSANQVAPLLKWFRKFYKVQTGLTGQPPVAQAFVNSDFMNKVQAKAKKYAMDKGLGDVEYNLSDYTLKQLEKAHNNLIGGNTSDYYSTADELFNTGYIDQEMYNGLYHIGTQYEMDSKPFLQTNDDAAKKIYADFAKHFLGTKMSPDLLKQSWENPASSISLDDKQGIFNALAKGDFKTAEQLANTIVNADDYKKSLLTFIDGLNPEKVKAPQMEPVQQQAGNEFDDLSTSFDQVYTAWTSGDKQAYKQAFEPSKPVSQPLPSTDLSNEKLDTLFNQYVETAAQQGIEVDIGIEGEEFYDKLKSAFTIASTGNIADAIGELDDLVNNGVMSETSFKILHDMVSQLGMETISSGATQNPLDGFEPVDKVQIGGFKGAATIMNSNWIAGDAEKALNWLEKKAVEKGDNAFKWQAMALVKNYGLDPAKVPETLIPDEFKEKFAAYKAVKAPKQPVISEPEVKAPAKVQKPLVPKPTTNASIAEKEEKIKAEISKLEKENITLNQEIKNKQAEITPELEIKKQAEIDKYLNEFATKYPEYAKWSSDNADAIKNAMVIAFSEPTYESMRSSLKQTLQNLPGFDYQAYEKLKYLIKPNYASFVSTLNKEVEKPVQLLKSKIEQNVKQITSQKTALQNVKQLAVIPEFDDGVPEPHTTDSVGVRVKRVLKNWAKSTGFPLASIPSGNGERTVVINAITSALSTTDPTKAGSELIELFSTSLLPYQIKSITDLIYTERKQPGYEYSTPGAIPKPKPVDKNAPKKDVVGGIMTRYKVPAHKKEALRKAIMDAFQKPYGLNTKQAQAALRKELMNNHGIEFEIADKIASWYKRKLDAGITFGADTGKSEVGISTHAALQTIPAAEDPEQVIKPELVKGETVIMHTGENKWKVANTSADQSFSIHAAKEQDTWLKETHPDMVAAFKECRGMWQSSGQYHHNPQSRKKYNDVFTTLTEGPPPHYTPIKNYLERGMNLTKPELKLFLEAFEIGQTVYLGPSGFSENSSTAQGFGSNVRLIVYSTRKDNKLKALRLAHTEGEGYSSEKEIILGTSKNLRVKEVIKHVSKSGYYGQHTVSYEIIMEQIDEVNESFISESITDKQQYGFKTELWKGLSPATVKTIIKYCNSTVNKK